ncbi:hypothetical protein Aph01nite_18390 [Acrocarpospora phusangensis]|uniref:Uncharacterized protein n=1 Tax=Acrocarpospora phusangensis TaxID=1070424 RepID=A0A919Q987_9ACTN|nr:hypothetical protein [Acrocarpospora phusangensis]GIH23529.1 hypothetical protein Aph01nite_18390 [Acrocarpospora phusangensis]
MTVLGVDAGSADVAAAEHLIQDLVTVLGPPVLACTHFVRNGRPHVAVTLVLEPAEVPDGYGVAWGDSRTGPEELAAGAGQAVAEFEAGGGRAVVFGGSAGLSGVVTVADLLGRSAIERVSVLASPYPAEPHAVLDTRGYLRPERRDGVLTLATTPGLLPDGSIGLVPFEILDPQACCGGH